MRVIYLIRHGQASFLKEDYDQLSDLGINQSTLLGNSLKDRNTSFSHLVSGSMKRHQQTANHFLVGSEQIIVEDGRWDEYDHMELLVKHNPLLTNYESIGSHIMKESNPMKALQNILNDSIHDWMIDAHDYGQTWKSFKENAWNALNELADQLEKRQNACVFTSGGPIAVILLHLLSLADKQFIDLQARMVNTSVTKVLVGKSKLSLSTYNEYSHLDHNPELITYR